MWFSKVLLAALLMPAIAVAGDKAIDDILDTSRDARKNAEDVMGGIPETPVIDEGVLGDSQEWLKGQSLPQMEANDEARATAQQRAWSQIATGTNDRAQAAALGEGPERPPTPEDVMYVYISLSMPDETIRALFNQAIANKELRSVVFVLRGWTPPNLNEVIGKLNKLFPEAQKLQELPNVQIDPNLYEQQNVELVPTFSTKDKAGRWGSVVGSTSITDAVSRIESNKYDGTIIGPTFEIEEPNILEVIRERIAKVDWTDQVERVKESVLTKKTTGRTLPRAHQSDSYLVDLTVVNNRTLRGAKGEAFAAAGASVNPFDYLTTEKRYVFFDANDPDQLDQAVRWRNEYNYTTLITTIPLRTMEGRESAHERLRQPIYEINDLLIQRFQLRAVPSIAYQEGRMLRVDVVAVQDGLTAKSQGEP